MSNTNHFRVWVRHVIYDYIRIFKISEIYSARMGLLKKVCTLYHIMSRTQACEELSYFIWIPSNTHWVFHLCANKLKQISLSILTTDRDHIDGSTWTTKGADYGNSHLRLATDFARYIWIMMRPLRSPVYAEKYSYNAWYISITIPVDNLEPGKPCYIPAIVCIWRIITAPQIKKESLVIKL